MVRITMSDIVLKDGKIVNIVGKEEESEPIIISDSIPMFIKDENGRWIKNPEYIECNN